MAQIKINNLSFQYDTHGEDIFKNVCINIDTDWKLGLIGRNGRGKTTFLKLLQGEYKYSGQIISPVSFDYFPMTVDDDNKDALEVMRESIAPFTKWEKELEIYSNNIEYMKEYGEVLEKFIDHDGYIINEVIEKEVRKMGLETEILNRTFKTLSLGEQTKLLLVALFLKKNNFLLIDEPTNHLDTEGRECVAKYLQKKSGFILVSHDRDFLDKVINHILSINKNNIDIQKGNYSTWQLNNSKRDDFEKSENEKLLKEIKRLQIAAKQKSNWSNKVEATKKGCGPVDRGFIGHKAAKIMKRAKCLEKRQNKAIEEKSKLLKNIEEVEKLKISNIDSSSNKILEVIDLQIIYEKEYQGAIYIDYSEQEIYELSNGYLDEQEYEVYMQAQRQMKNKLRTNMQILKIPYKEVQGNVKTITFPNRYSVDLEAKGGNVILFIQGSEPFIMPLSSIDITTLNQFFSKGR